jgi:RimJ/RimL family protein N-acetyltransferase/AcrR family transcriptional regulator
VIEHPPKQRLLDRAIEYVAGNGLGGLTLRGLAAEIGTSHRMLIHHFGSKEGLWVEIVRTVEQRQRELLGGSLPGPSQPLGDAMRAWWEHISDRSLWPNERLFFELYGQALQGRPHTTELLDGIVDSWLGPIAQVSIERGIPPRVAHAHARLGVAVTRGLLLDLLATQDVAGVNAAMEAFIELYESCTSGAGGAPQGGAGPGARKMSRDRSGHRLMLRPLASGDEADLIRIHRLPEITRWWDLPAPAFPWDEPTSTRLTIEVDGKIAGLIQYWEEPEPKYRHAGIDLFLEPAFHGLGLGTEAVRLVVRRLIDDHGHHRITIDPATANVPAIRCYEKAGFKPVGVMRRYERDVGGDGWHDASLMELLAGEEHQSAGARSSRRSY